MIATATLPLTGKALLSNATPAAGIYVTAIDRSSLAAQYSAMTRADGRFEFSLPAGSYDLIFNALSNRPITFFHVGVMLANPARLEAVLPPANVSDGVSGHIILPTGETTGWEISAQALAREPASAVSAERRTQVSPDGFFQLAALPAGYYLVTLTHQPSGRSQDAMVPVGDRPIVMAFDARNAVTANSHANDLRIATCGCQPQEPQAGWIFSQNYPFGFDTVVDFTGGTIQVGLSPPLATTNMVTQYEKQPATNLCIYLAEAKNLIYSYVLTVQTVVGGDATYCKPVPTGVWNFTDATGDTYTLSAVFPGTHIVRYNSSDPTITAVRFYQFF